MLLSLGAVMHVTPRRVWEMMEALGVGRGQPGRERGKSKRKERNSDSRKVVEKTK